MKVRLLYCRIRNKLFCQDFSLISVNNMLIGVV